MPGGDFSRPTAKKKLKKKTVPPRPDIQTKGKSGTGYTKPKAVTRAPISDVRSSGPDYSTKTVEAYKKTPGYKRIVRTTTAKVDRDKERLVYAKTAAVAAKAGRPFSVDAVRHAISLSLPEASNLSVRSEDGAILRKYKRSLLGVDSAVSDYWAPLDSKSGLPKVEVYGEGANKKAGLDAAGVKLIEQTMRPGRAVIGAADRLSKGEGLGGAAKGFKEGLIDNKPAAAGTILKRAGLPSGVAGGLGFIIDVAADPTTYVTLGTAGVAKRAAANAAEQTHKKALAKGMTREGAETVAKRAAKIAAEKAAPGRGLTVSFVGKELPGITRATAKTGRGAKRVANKAPKRVKTVGATAKDMVREVRPQIRPAHTPEAQFKEIRQVGRKARATIRAGFDEGTDRGRGLADRLDANDFDAVINAIERAKISKLPKHLQKTARFMRDEFRGAQRARRRAGVPEGSIRNYFPHARKDKLEGGKGVVEHVSDRAGRTVSGPARKIKKTVRDANAANVAKHGEELFSTNVPLVYANYKRQTAQKVGTAQLARDLAAAGEKVKAKILDSGDRVYDLRPLKTGEALYHVGPDAGRYGIREIEESRIGRVGGPAKGGQYAIINKRLVDQQLQGMAHGAERGPIGSLFDRGTGGFKRLATATPGFHARNQYGDTEMAYLAQPGHRLPVNAASAAKALKRLSATDVGQRGQLGRIGKSAKTIKVAGKRQGLDQFLAGARTNGVIRSGPIGRDLEELKGVGKPTTTAGYRKLPRPVGKKARASHDAAMQAAARAGLATADSVALRAEFKRWFQNREDWMRLATYKHGLDKGMKEADAADLSLGMHIDYGDLTSFERNVARRAIPFYTFAARALPIHAKALVQKPGKFAAYGKAVEEAAIATGIDLREERKHLKEYQARQVPIILKVGGKKVVLSLGLPLSLLNELPTNGDVGAYLDEIGNWLTSMANPIFKNPVEWRSNFSFFYRSQIESEQTPLVAAPDWAKRLYNANPDSVIVKKLGIVNDFTDPRSGKEVFGWSPKADYFFKQFPGIVNFAQQITTTGVNRRGQTQGQRALSFAAGIRVEDLDPVGAAMEILYDKYEKNQKESTPLSRRADSLPNIRRLAELQAEQSEIERQINALSVERGDPQPLFAESAGAAPTVRVDAELSLLRARREKLKAQGKHLSNGFYTPEWNELGTRISALTDRRKKIRKIKDAPRGKQRPMTEDEKRLEKFNRRLERLDGDQAGLEKLNERVARLAGG